MSILKDKKTKIGLVVLLLIVVVFVTKKRDDYTCAITTLTPAVINTVSVEGVNANLSWTNGEKSIGTYLNVSTSQSLKPDGTLEQPGIVNDVVTGRTAYSVTNLSPGTYYWNIVSDGCKLSKRKVSNLGSFTIEKGAINACEEVTPATLDKPSINGQRAALSWTVGKNNNSLYINISSSNSVNEDGILKKVDVANDVVTGKTSYSRDNLPTGTYYWNIVGDGCQPVQREVSNLGTFIIQ